MHHRVFRVGPACKCGVLGEVTECTQGVITNAALKYRKINLGFATFYTQVGVKESAGVL